MLEREKILKIAQEWIGKAENDLTNAVNTLKMGKRGPTDTVCFHAQQCVEKYLKATLVWKGIDFPKTHNISELMAQPGPVTTSPPANTPLMLVSLVFWSVRTVPSGLTSNPLKTFRSTF